LLTDDLHNVGLFSDPLDEITELNIFHRWAAPFHHSLPLILSTVNLSSPSWRIIRPVKTWAMHSPTSVETSMATCGFSLEIQ